MQVILVLQGGGALGAYHVGAYQALEEEGYRPSWIAGISIGAINAAIIAGNLPGNRLEKLEEFWDRISRPDGWGAVFTGNFRRWFNMFSAAEAFVLGQPNFFVPRLPNPYFAWPGTPGATSFYDTAPLHSTLRNLVNFDLINKRPVRLSLGATRVTTGEMVFFDNTDREIGPEHVMASGSLPPGFPAMRIDGELYWDGGCVSNTPLEAVLKDLPRTRTLVFMIDLWNARGPEPTTIDDVLWRQKRIQYSSRTSVQIEAATHRIHEARLMRELTLARAARAEDGPVAEEIDYGQYETIDIVHLIYDPPPEQIPQSDAEFSRPSIADRRAAGYAEMKRALKDAPWRTVAERTDIGAVVHRVRGGQVA
jgi:NTE family protein